MSGKKRAEIKRNIAGYLFLLPWLLGFFGFTIIPMIASFYFSLTDYDMFTPPKFVGLGNYIGMISDKKVLASLSVTFRFVLMSVPLQLAAALAVALALKKNRRGVRLYRAVYYLPSLFGGSIAVAILWKKIFSQEGVLNQILAVVGIKGINWIATPSTSLYTLILLAAWQFGSSMVIFLASLKQIPTDYYEAATIDGAGKIRQFTGITLPLLTPMVFFNVVMQIINAFQSFTPAYIISNGTGAPLDSTLFYTLNLYIMGFMRLRMGYASALAWVLLVIIALFTGAIFLSAKKWVHYD
ncbi:MAG: sugar ABC transporter permease [Clostridiales bacterium]|jgi:multiple sugar transport system permease protein|nr:sugar ABC transporter permease [Clostridiales bacterium]MDR2751264.1 sugar ABC transporter permease [Clostridiales bacterium]